MVILFGSCIQGPGGAEQIGQIKQMASVTQSPADQTEAGMLPESDEGLWCFHAETLRLCGFYRNSCLKKAILSCVAIFFEVFVALRVCFCLSYDRKRRTWAVRRQCLVDRGDAGRC